MSTTTKRGALFFAASLLVIGCDGGGGDDAGTDAGDRDAGPIASGTPSCATYCSNLSANCTGANAQYASEAECLTVCDAVSWAPGEDVTESGPLSGNTLGCRQYHGGVPAEDDPDLHCSHAGDTGGDVCGTFCEAYCELVLSVCTGADEIFANGEECMTACAGYDDSGTIGASSGDTVQCRLYHVSAAVREDNRTLHCPHAAPDGGGACVGPWTFSTTAPAAYTRVDAMGMPAVSTALVSSATKNAYNDASPENTTFAAELVANLTALHGALDDDLTGAGLTPCTMTAAECLTQEIAAGVSVQSLVVPDDLTLDLDATSSFPNGRGLTEPVIDVTLSILLLDVDVTRAAGTPPHDPTTLVGVLNRTANDVALPAEFPYFAPPHQP